jgi:hypothetical protein
MKWGPMKPMLDIMLQPLEDAFGNLIGDKKNDSFVPLYSQMAQNISVSSSVRKYSQLGYHHFYGMTSPGQNINTYGEIVNFINKVLEDKQ